MDRLRSQHRAGCTPAWPVSIARRWAGALVDRLAVADGTAFRSPTLHDLYGTFRLGATLFVAELTLQPESLLSGESRGQDDASCTGR